MTLNRSLADKSLKVNRKKALVPRRYYKVICFEIGNVFFMFIPMLIHFCVGLFDFALGFQFVRNQIFNKARNQVMKMSLGLYPAPLKIIDVVKTGFDKGKKAGFLAESIAFGELAMTKERQALFGLFYGQTECKKNRFGTPQRKAQLVISIGLWCFRQSYHFYLTKLFSFCK